MAAGDQKSEKPTPRRLIKAREEGNFPTARTFVGSMQFLAFVALLHVWGPAWIKSLQNGFMGLIQTALNPKLYPRDLLFLCVALMKQLMIPIGMMGAVMIGITIAVQLVVTGFGISLKKLTPDLKRLNPLARSASASRAESGGAHSGGHYDPGIRRRRLLPGRRQSDELSRVAT